MPDALVVTVPVAAGTSLLEVVRALDAAGVAATDVHRREATLDDVFLSLTDEGGRLMSHVLALRTRWLVSDSLALAGRNLEHVRQIPEKLLDVDAAADHVRAAVRVRLRRRDRRPRRRLPRTT